MCYFSCRGWDSAKVLRATAMAGDQSEPQIIDAWPSLTSNPDSLYFLGKPMQRHVKVWTSSANPLKDLSLCHMLVVSRVVGVSQYT